MNIRNQSALAIVAGAVIVVAAAYWRHWKREHEEQEDNTQSTTNTPSHQQQRPTGRRTVIPSNSVTNQSSHYEGTRQDPIEKSNDADDDNDSIYADNGLPIEEVDRRLKCTIETIEIPATDAPANDYSSPSKPTTKEDAVHKHYCNDTSHESSIPSPVALREALEKDVLSVPASLSSPSSASSDQTIPLASIPLSTDETTTESTETTVSAIVTARPEISITQAIIAPTTLLKSLQQQSEEKLQTLSTDADTDTVSTTLGEDEEPEYKLRTFSMDTDTSTASTTTSVSSARRRIFSPRTTANYIR
jgi:single-stranded DNA-binding protein